MVEQQRQVEAAADGGQRFGHAAPRVRGRVRKMKGTFSGGTAAPRRMAAPPEILR